MLRNPRQNTRSFPCIVYAMPLLTTGPRLRQSLDRMKPYNSNDAMKLSDGSSLGISTETIASHGHSFGCCPEGMIWFKVVRNVVTTEYDIRQVRQFWTQVPLPRDVEEVKQYLALVRKKDGRVSWMFLYLSELSPDHLGWFTNQDWENVRAWLASPPIIQVLRDALELCRQQHQTNVKAPSQTLALDKLQEFPAPLTSDASQGDNAARKFRGAASHEL